MPSIGPMELIVVLVIALVIIGPKKLPGAARSLGSSMRGFKDSLTGGSDTSELPASTGDAAPAERNLSQPSAVEAYDEVAAPTPTDPGVNTISIS